MAVRAATLEARLLGGLITATPGWAGLWFTPLTRCSLPDGSGKVYITLSTDGGMSRVDFKAVVK
jgi:hypothetical protein